MAHIPDGILSVPVLIAGAAVAAAGAGLALRRIDDRGIVRAAVLSAAFLAGSMVAIPVGPGSVHLLLGGLMGLMLGTGTFLAVLVALLLQALMFGFGGLTTLGVNAANIALPGVVLAALAGPLLRRAARPAARAALGAALGAGSVLGTGALVALSLRLSAPEYTPVASVMLATYLPLALAEGAVTAAVVGFLARVRPQALAPAA